MLLKQTQDAAVAERRPIAPKGTLLDFSTLVIYFLVGGLIIGSALLGL
jgi:hypothetical protein